MTLARRLPRQARMTRRFAGNITRQRRRVSWFGDVAIRSLAPLALALSLSSCAALRGRPPEREATVSLRVSRTEAVRRTHAAFRDQGYQIRETPTSGTSPETEEFRHDDADVVFRAEITGSATSSRVVFSGTYRPRRLGGLVRGDARPVVNSDDPLERALWARLNNLALMLRRVDSSEGGFDGWRYGLRGAGVVGTPRRATTDLVF